MLMRIERPSLTLRRPAIEPSMTKAIRPSAQALQRKRVLYEAKALGVTTACKAANMDRTSFYKWKGRYTASGISGLEDRPPIREIYDHALSDDGRQAILHLTELNPGRGCEWIAAELKVKGFFDQSHDVSKTTVQKVLNRACVGSAEERWVKLEENIRRLRLRRVFQLPEHAGLLGRFNPNHRDYDIKIKAPGAHLFADSMPVGSIEGMGRIHLHAVIDGFSGYAFAQIDRAPSASGVASVLESAVLPFFGKHAIAARNLITASALAASAIEVRELATMLKLHHIKHTVRPKVDGSISGFAERFVRAVKREFLPNQAQSKSLTELRKQFCTWRAAYNKQALEGYPNYGCCPFQLIRAGGEAGKSVSRKLR